MKFNILVLCCIPLLAFSEPPQAKKIPAVKQACGVEWVDDYAWIRPTPDKDTLHYIQAENEYTRQATAPIKELEETLYEEMRERLNEGESFLQAYQSGDVLYYLKQVPHELLPILCRSAGQRETILLDPNELESESFNIGSFLPDSSNTFLAFTYETDGSENYRLKILNLQTGVFLEEDIEGVNDEFVWSKDGKSIFYLALDPSMRAYQMKRHRLGSSPSDDEWIYEEPSSLFFIKLIPSADQSTIWIASVGADSSEVRYLDQNGQAQLIQPRQKGVKYLVENGDNNSFYILTNQNARNYRLVKMDRLTGREEEILPHDPGVSYESLHRARDYLVLTMRKDGFQQIRILNINAPDVSDISFEQPTYQLQILQSGCYDNVLRFSFSSPIMPKQIVDYHLDTDEKVVVKSDAAGKQYNQYVVERIDIAAPDGVFIPVSLFYKKGIVFDGLSPMFLMGYGAYGASYDMPFSPEQMGLVKRGVIIAVAHVRGGGERGAVWHDAGKEAYKTNTFHDFIACAESLIEQKYTSSSRLVIYGRSAGGMLIGTAINWNPDLFKAAVAEVPFVDVLNTMLDPAMPWTTFEYNEWGNPNDIPCFEIMKSYSPYDNVARRNVPSLLIKGALNDSRVSFSEPTKWAAKLRAYKTDDNPLYLQIDMEGGHLANPNLSRRLRDRAFTYAFVLNEMGIDH